MTIQNYFEMTENGEYAFLLEGNKEIFGVGALEEVGAHAKGLGMSRVSGLVSDYYAEGWPRDHALVPHGFAVIVNSPSVFRFMGPVCPDRHAEAARTLGVIAEVDKEPGEILADGIIDIMRVLDVPNGLVGLGYTADDLDVLTEKGWLQRRVVDNAARPITKEEMRSIFAGALSYW